jgi:DNA polymerase
MNSTAGLPSDSGALRALLSWYAAMGVDAALSEEPIDRTVARATAASPVRRDSEVPMEMPAAPAPVVPVMPSVSFTAASVVETERLARDAAAAATNLDELRAALARFEGCNLRHTATNLVFADGNPAARVMMIGEAPGRDEDIKGLPFVGRAGQLLDRMLAAIGLSRESVYIANIVPWRPPGNRTPTPQESAACRPFIARQIELANPDFLICLGGSALRELLGVSDGIIKMRGKWLLFDNAGRKIRAMGMLHPAYLLRQPLHKRLAWRDLIALRKALDEAPAQA